MPGSPAVIAGDLSGLWIDAIGVAKAFGQPGQIGDHGMYMALRIRRSARSEEHTSELQSLMRISYAVFCLKKEHKKTNIYIITISNSHIYNHNQHTLNYQQHSTVSHILNTPLI